MRLEARVNAVYGQLTANERELVSHILQEKQQVRGMNSTQLAQHLHVSRTTLVRFWKKLGVQSYAEFRLLLQQDQRELDAPGVELGAIVRMYHAMIDELPKLPYGRVCRLLRAAPTIYIYGTGNEQKAIAEEFKRIFLLLGKCCVDLAAWTCSIWAKWSRPGGASAPKTCSWPSLCRGKARRRCG